MKSYKLYIDNLEVFAIIGILDHEREKEQKIVVDVEIEYFRSGDNFVNYKYIAQTITDNIKKRKYGLLEDALDDLMLRIKEDYPVISTMKLKITKPEILDNCIVGVERFKEY